MADIQNSEDELIKYFPVSFKAPDLSDIVTGDDGESGLLAFIRELLLDDEQKLNGNSIEDVVAALNDGIRSVEDNDLKTKVNEIIKVFASGTPLDGATEENTDPVEFIDPQEIEDGVPNVSSILINDQRAGPAMRNVKRLQLFFNSIPTVEMSKSVPYLDVRLQSLLVPSDEGTPPKRLSLLKFLEKSLSLGNTNDGTSADSIMTAAERRGGQENPGSKGKIRLNPGSFSTGMEVFTSPQTLIDQSANVIDPYRPFLTIEGFSVSAVGGDGTTTNMSKDTAELKLVLHDRSRMGDIAEFVGLGMFSHVKLLVTYGWNHPDGLEVGNPFADLLNNSRVQKFYTVANVSYQLESAGQVKLTLKLVEASKTEMYAVRISEGKFEPQQKLIERIRLALNNIERKAGLMNDKERSKSVTIKQVLNAATQYGATPEVAKHLRPFLDKFLRRDPKFDEDIDTLISRDDVIKFLDKLTELSGPSGTDGTESDQPIAHLKSQVDQHIRRKVESLLLGPDPFQPALVHPNNPHRRIPIAVEEAKEFPESGLPLMVSLGKIMSSFIAPAILRGGDTVNEIQFIYYPFNERAGGAANLNIGTFMIEYEKFVSAYQRLSSQRSTSDFAMTDMFELIIDLISDPGALFYDVIPKRPDPSKDPRKQSKGVVAQEKTEGKSALTTLIEEKLAQDEGQFKQALLQFDLETIPITKTEQNSGNVNVSRRTLLKVHVMDKNASPYIGAVELLAAGVKGELQTLRKGSPPEIIQKAIELGLVRIGEDGVILSNANARSIINYVKSLSPSVTYGANNSMILEAGLASHARPEDTTIAIQRESRFNPLQPPGSSNSGLPMKVHPVKLEVNMVGCPLLRTQQQLFFDFGTNTDADDIYNIIRFNHEIGPGRFTTRVELYPKSGYPEFYTAIGTISRAISSLKETVKKIE